MWRNDHPEDDERTVRLCADMWPLARAALGAGDLADADASAHAQFFQAMCRWRVHFATKTLGDDARAAVAVITCAARLVLLDVVNGDSARLAALDAALDGWRGSVRREELAGLCRFVPHASRAAWRDAAIVAAGAWFERRVEDAWPACLTECATHVLIRIGGLRPPHPPPHGEPYPSPMAGGVGGEAPQGAEAPHAEEAFLRFAAELDADCCLRCSGAFQLRGLAVPPPEAASVTDAEVTAARAWLRSKAANVGEALAERARELMFRASLPPWALRRIGPRKPSACFMEFTRNEKRAAACALGIRAVSAEATTPPVDEHDLGLLLLACAGYLIMQNCNFEISDKLIVLDNDPYLVRARFMAHMRERVLAPPPLLIRTHDATYMLHRRREPGAYDAVHAYPTLAHGVIAWLRHVHDDRRGVLFLDRKIGAFVEDALGRTTRASAAIELNTIQFV
jgi:hypothetical protein